MHVIFLDDSGQQKIRRAGLGELVALGAVIVHESAIAPYESAIAAIRRDYGIPADEEIKWKPPKGSALAQLAKAPKRDFRRRMLAAAAEHGISSAVAIVDHSRAYTKEDTIHIGLNLLQWIYDSVGKILESCGSTGIIIADTPGGGSRENRQWLRETLQLTEFGTLYTKPGLIVMPVVTAPSDHVPLLQLADLVTAATTSAVAGHLSGLDLADSLLHLAHKHQFGHSGGAGIKIWPPELRNLQKWVFDESTCSYEHRTVRLPYRGTKSKPWPFADDNGLPHSTGLSA